MKRESFIFYRSFMEALDALSDKQYAKVFRAISKFALDGIEPELTGVERAIFQLVKPQLVANQKRYENGCKGGRNARENNQTETENKPKENQEETEINQTETKSTPNDNDNVNDNDNDNDNVNVNDNYNNLKIINNKTNNTGRDVGLIFKKMIYALEDKISPISYSTYITPLQSGGIDGNKLILLAPNSLFSNVIKENYLCAINDVVRAVSEDVLDGVILQAVD